MNSIPKYDGEGLTAFPVVVEGLRLVGADLAFIVALWENYHNTLPDQGILPGEKLRVGKTL